MTRRHVLDSGASVLIDEMRDVRSLAVGFFCRTGSADEPQGRRGLSHFLEHLLFKRTRRRSTLAIARAIDRLGGDADAFTAKEYTAFYAHSLDTKFGEALDLLADVVLSPAFSPEDVERERGVVLEEIAEANDSPDDLAHELFLSSFWRHHPLGEPILGTAESVRSITHADLEAFYRERYVPRNLIVSVAGHVRGAEALDAIARVFSRRRGGSVAEFATRRPRPYPHCRMARRKGLDQAHVCLGMSGPAHGSPRRFAAQLLDIVLGGGMSSRLFQEVREKKGLVYSIGSSLTAYRLGGYESIQASCAPRNLPRMIDTSLAVLRRVRHEGVRPLEVRRAKEFLKGNFLLGLESTVSRMSAQARRECYLERTERPEDWLARVDAVEPDEVSEAARDLLSDESLSLTVVGDLPRLAYSNRDLSRAVA